MPNINLLTVISSSVGDFRDQLICEIKAYYSPKFVTVIARKKNNRNFPPNMLHRLSCQAGCLCIFLLRYSYLPNYYHLVGSGDIIYRKAVCFGHCCGQNLMFSPHFVYKRYILYICSGRKKKLSFPFAYRQGIQKQYSITDWGKASNPAEAICPPI